ncbi:MAG: hypothetical protein GY895_22300 [Phycisphaera sp.]|nr:hypothetical protein [Phycisphaera sp.]
MIRTYVASAAFAFGASTLANADVMSFTGWEDTSADAIFGSYGNIGGSGYTSAPAPVYDGNHSLFLQEDPLAGTPNAVLAWVSGISAGDTITATMWFRGTDAGSGQTSKARIWGAYYDSTDSSTYNSSAGGNNDYAGEGGVWESVSYTWTANGNTSVFGLQARVYAYGENTMIWGDNLEISVNNDNATIEVAGAASTPVVPGPAIGFAMLGGLAAVGRRRR